LLPNKPENWPKTELNPLPDPELLFPPVKPPNKLPRPEPLFPPPRRLWAWLSIPKGPDCSYLPKSFLAIPLTDSGKIAVQSPLISWRVWIGSRLSSGLNLCSYRRLWLIEMAIMPKMIVNERSFISYQ
jgi:hypothetical protein